MTCSPSITAFTFNEPSFRLQYPAFADSATYPTQTLEAYFEQASCWIANKNYGWLNGCCNLLSLNLLTAHLASLATQIAAGQTPGIETQATIDKVSVTMMTPPYDTPFQYWLGQSPYGQQLLSILYVKGVGGQYVPGSYGRAGFGFSGAGGRSWYR